MKFYLILLIEVFITVEGWSCVFPVTKVFKRVNTEAVLQFDLSGYINKQTVGSVSVIFHDNSPRVVIKFNTGVITYSKVSGVDVSADLSGHVVFTIQNVKAEDAGIYYITSINTPTKCSCLYILGTPTRTAISVDNPSVGGRATLFCKSSSTTTPSNHSLGLIYSWRVDNIDNPSGPRYTNSTSRNKLTLSNIVKEDAIKQFTCMATEDVTGGYTSSQSDSMSLNVLYGPDMAEVSVNSPYTVTEGEMPEDISCSSDCYPGCSYSWINATSGSVISSDAVLSLGTVTRYMAGIYKCTVSNTAASVYTKSSENSTTVIVRHAVDVSVAISPLNTTEGANVTLFCIGHGVPSEYYYTGVTHTVNGILIPNTNKELIGTQQYSSIHFPSLRLEDTGLYTCKLNNKVKSTSGVLDQTSSVNVTVKVLPKVFTDDLRFTGVTGGNVQIAVPIYSFPELDTVSVTRYDGAIIKQDDKYNFTTAHAAITTKFYDTSVTLNGSVFKMAIRNLLADDFGNYTITLTNRLGSTAFHTLIITEGPPSPPKNFQFLSDHKTPTFIWEKNFNGGPAQSFVLQTSLPDTDQWINHTSIHETDPRYRINTTFYIVEINLESGTYKARIIARNVKGESEAVELGYTFDISNKEGSSSSRVEKCDSCTVVGSSLGVICVILAIYAGTVTILWRRGMVIKGVQETGKLEQQMTYVNLTSKQSNTGIKTIQEDLSKEAQYTSLERQSRDDRSTYDVLG